MNSFMIVNVDPEAQKRAKANGRGAFIRMYDPSADYKHILEAFITEAMSEFDISRIEEGIPVYLGLEFVKPRIKSIGKKTPPACKKPDVDNFSKAVMDAANEILYSDDGQVTTIYAHKRYAYPEEEHGIIVTVGVSSC